MRPLLALLLFCFAPVSAKDPDKPNPDEERLTKLVTAVKEATALLETVKTPEDFVAACASIDQSFSQLTPLIISKISPEVRGKNELPLAMQGLSKAIDELNKGGESHKVISSRLATSLELHILGRTLGFQSSAQVKKSMTKRIELQEAAYTLGVAKLGGVAEKDDEAAEVQITALKHLEATTNHLKETLQHPWLSEPGVAEDR